MRLTKNNKPDITDNVLRTYEADNYDKADNSYTQSVLNMVQPNRLDNMQDEKVPEGKLDITTGKENSGTKAKAHDT